MEWPVCTDFAADMLGPGWITLQDGIGLSLKVLGFLQMSILTKCVHHSFVLQDRDIATAVWPTRMQVPFCTSQMRTDLVESAAGLQVNVQPAGVSEICSMTCSESWCDAFLLDNSK